MAADKLLELYDELQQFVLQTQTRLNQVRSQLSRVPVAAAAASDQTNTPMLTKQLAQPASVSVAATAATAGSATVEADDDEGRLSAIKQRLAQQLKNI